MKVLFLPGLSSSTLYLMAGLARAAQLAGHTVMVAAPDAVADATIAIGLPTVSVTGMTIQTAHPERDGEQDGERLEPPEDPDGRSAFLGRMFGRLAAASMPALREFSQHWRPDVVVAAQLVFAAPLLAAELGVPFVRHAWGADETSREDGSAAVELVNELAPLGLDTIPAPTHRVEIAPARFTAITPGAEGASFMRWIPANAQCRLEPWMYRRGERRRVCITDGSRATAATSLDHLERLVAALSGPDVEILVAAPEQLAAQLRRSCDVRAGWIPLDVVAPTCDLVVHQGGGVTNMTVLRAGVPQLFIPRWDLLLDTARLITGAGAAVMLAPGADTSEAVAAGAATLLADPAHREQAARLAAEMAALPPTAEAVCALEKLAG